MVRIAFHGPSRTPPKVARLTAIYRAIFPPKPLIIQAAHYPKYHLASNRATAIHRAHPASATSRLRTNHFSAKPRVMLERFVVICGAVLVTGCVVYWATSRDEVVLTKRQRTMAFSWDFEKRLFSAKDDEKSQSEDSSLGSILDPSTDERAEIVLKITTLILEVMENEFPQIYKQLDWNVFVRKNPKVNAFYKPGGSLTVFSGLIDMVAEAENKHQLENARNALALVISHELAHGTFDFDFLCKAYATGLMFP
jgi:hypothetical protein